MVTQMVKNLTAMKLGWSPGEGNGYPVHYSCLENSTEQGAWWATPHGIAKSQTQLSDLTLLSLQK